MMIILLVEGVGGGGGTTISPMTMRITTFVIQGYNIIFGRTYLS